MKTLKYLTLHLTDVNLNNFKSTFKLKGFDDTPTNVRISVTNIDEAKEVKKS
jgi:hypothetical protein